MVKVTLPLPVKKIIKVLHDNGFEAHAVGGSIRDTLLKKETKGWDFTTNAKPEQIQQVFPKSFYNNNFGTVSITQEHLKEQFPDLNIPRHDKNDVYEITTYRSESGYSDKRHPDSVNWGNSLEEDLKRRDFTMNSLATISPMKDENVLKENKFPLVDNYDGEIDIKNKIVRAVGDPNERFQEDALRMMRAIRFAAELGFTIEPNTLSAIKANAHLLQQISWERIRDELLKILKSPFPYEGMIFLRQTGLLKIILPELEACFGVEQKSPNRHHIYDVGNHSLLSLKNCPSSDPIVRLATLLHDVGKAKTYRVLSNGTITFYNHEVVGARLVDKIADRLRLSKEQKDKLWTLVRWHQFTVDEHQTDSAIRRFIRRVGVDKIQQMTDLRIGDRLGGGIQTATSWRLRLYMKRVVDVQKHTPTVSDLKVNGDDVMKILKIKPGPKVGEILNKLFAEITDDPKKNKKEYLTKRIISFLPKVLEVVRR